MTVPDFDERARDLSPCEFTSPCIEASEHVDLFCHNCQLASEISTALAAVWNEAIEKAAKVAHNAPGNCGASRSGKAGYGLCDDIRALLAGKEKK
jgi:hypothetical protein